MDGISNENMDGIYGVRMEMDGKVKLSNRVYQFLPGTPNTDGFYIFCPV